MLYTPLSSLPYPAGSQAPALAADPMTLVTALDPAVTTIVQNVSDRDAKLVNAPRGKIAASIDGDMWVKISDPGSAVWLAVATTETYTGFAWNTSPPFTDNGNSALTRTGSVYSLFLGATYQGPDVTSGPTGFLTDVQIATITDPSWRPVSGQSVTFTFVAAPDFGGTGIIYGSSGTVNMSDARPSATLTAGTTVALSASWVRPA